ncbi:hypothetical protein ABK040_006326 [Willaertia magna]
MKKALKAAKLSIPKRSTLRRAGDQEIKIKEPTKRQFFAYSINLHANNPKKEITNDLSPLSSRSTLNLYLTEKEIHLLNTIETTMQLSNLDNVKYSLKDPFCFNLKNRTNAIQQIEMAATSNLNVNSFKNDMRQDITFMFARAGSGCGKSRIMTEVANILRNSEKVDEVFKRTSIIYYNFKNGFPLDPTKERDRVPVSMYASRLIFSAFENALSFAESIPPDISDAFLYELFGIISRKLHEQKNLDINIPIPIVLVLDEYQTVTRTFMGFHTSVQHKIGHYIMHFQRAHGLVILPAFAGTLISSDTPFVPTDYYPITLDLPVLTKDNIIEILEEEGIKVDEKSKTFWGVVGIVPRHLQWAIRYYNKPLNIFTKESILSNVYMNVLAKTLEHYMPTDSLAITRELKYLSHLTLSGFESKVFSNFKKHQELSPNIEKLVSEGKIYRYGTHTLLPLIIINAIEHMCGVPPNFLSDFIVMSKVPDWEKFERICLKTLTCRFNMCYYFENKRVESIKTLFAGALIPISLASTEIKVLWGDLFSFEEANISVSNLKRKNDTIYKTVVNEQGIDGALCVCENADTGEEIIIVTQCKLTTTKKPLYPHKIVECYRNAMKQFTNKTVIVVLFTNKELNTKTEKDILSGVINFKQNEEKMSISCPNLIVVPGSGSSFFNPFIADVLKDLKYKTSTRRSSASVKRLEQI